MDERSMKRALILCLAIACVLAGSCAAQEAQPKKAVAATDSIGAVLQAKAASILAKNCARCHGGPHPKMKLNLESARFVESLTNVPSRQVDTLKLVNTEKPEQSYLIMKLRGSKGIRGDRMPIDAGALTSEDIRAIELWVQSVAVHEMGRAPAVPPEPAKKKP